MAYRDDDEARRTFEAAAAQRSLPMLGRMEVASPCSMKWSEMDGDDRRRFCGKCKKHVYYLSGMTADEAEQFLLARDGVACVRYFQRADGTILLADCTIGRRNKRVVRIAAVSAALALVGGAADRFYAPESERSYASVDDTGIMGAVALSPELEQITETPPDEHPISDAEYRAMAGGVTVHMAHADGPPLIAHPPPPEPEPNFLPSDGTFRQSTPRRK